MINGDKDALVPLEHSEKMARDLASEEGRELERAFIDHQVEMHEDALKLIDDELVPVTTEPTLLDCLDRLRGVVSEHLQTARALKAGERSSAPERAPTGR